MHNLESKVLINMPRLQFNAFLMRPPDSVRAVHRFTLHQAHQDVFDHLRTALMSPNVMLHHPRLDKPYQLHTDASAVGAILTQSDEKGIQRPIQYI